MKKKGHCYSWNEHLGYIATCPSNLGTGLRAGVHVKLPNLAKDETKLDKVLDVLHLQKRGTGTYLTSVSSVVITVSFFQPFSTVVGPLGPSRLERVTFLKIQ